MRPTPNAPYTKPKCHICKKPQFPNQMTIKVIDGNWVKLCESCYIEDRKSNEPNQ